MKRNISTMLISLLIFTFTTSAYADQPVKNAVIELYSQDGYYEDEVGNKREFSYHIPQINENTPDAEEINAEIAEKFGSLAEFQFKAIEGGFSLSLNSTEWQAFWSGSQLFLLILADEEGDSQEYGAYGYDFETGTRVTNEMILEQRGISTEEYLEKLSEAVEAAFEESFIPIPEGVKTELSEETMLEETLGWLSIEQPMFIDQYGEIETIVRISCVAGLGWYYQLVAPFSGEV